MGLDAAVYRRLEELSFTEKDLSSITVDPKTGQVDFEDPALFRIWRDKIKAVEKRIGNSSFVNLLKTEIEELLGHSTAEMLLISKVLYSGTHSGDMISKHDLDYLRREIGLIRGIAGSHGSPELGNFLADMEELVVASEKHRNPIVFI